MNHCYSDNWYVLYVKSRHERKVENLLREIRIHTFVPFVKQVRKWSDRKKIVEVPLFPSYIFIKISSNTEFEKVRSVDGVCDYIHFGREYAKVTDEEINKIKLFLSINEFSDIETSSERLQIGQKYKITHGPLSGVECEVSMINNRDKIVVRIDSIRQNICATIPTDYLTEPAMLC